MKRCSKCKAIHNLIEIFKEMYKVENANQQLSEDASLNGW